MEILRIFWDEDLLFFFGFYPKFRRISQWTPFFLVHTLEIKQNKVFIPPKKICLCPPAPPVTLVARNLQWGGCYGGLGTKKSDFHLKLKQFLCPNSVEDWKKGPHLKLEQFLCSYSVEDRKQTKKSSPKIETIFMSKFSWRPEKSPHLKLKRFFLSKFSWRPNRKKRLLLKIETANGGGAIIYCSGAEISLKSAKSVVFSTFCMPIGEGAVFAPPPPPPGPLATLLFFILLFCYNAEWSNMFR